MIFNRLDLEDFRQFAGHQRIEFATDPVRNVTVVYGYNGAGKTTLLNAFTWFLFGQTSPDFLDADRLASEVAWAEAAVGAPVRTAVKASFEHGERTYVGERVRIVEKLDGGAQREIQRGTLALRYMDETGVLQEVRNPEDAVRQMLPDVLAPFFFFNGERIERLANPSAYEQVKAGIRVLLDIELLDRSVRHLRGKVSDALRDEIAENAGEEGARLRAEREALVSERDRHGEARAQLKRNEGALQDQLGAVEAKIRSQPELAKFQTERDALREGLGRLKGDLLTVKIDLARAVSDDGYLVLAKRALDEALARFDEAHAEGELPPPLKRQFVEELLALERCICDRSLDAGSPARAAVDAWRERAQPDAYAQIATTTRAAIRNSLSPRLEAFWRTVDELQRRRARMEKQKREDEERLSEISRSISDAPDEDYTKLEALRTRTEAQIRDAGVEAADLARAQSETDRQIQGKDHEIRQLDKAGDRGRRAQRRLAAVQNVAGALDRYRALRQESTREEVSRLVSEVWEETSIKEYRAQLDDAYHLFLTKDVDGEETPVRGASTGEKQVLSLAFVASLARKAQALYETRGDRQGGLFSGGQFPLVMDSPFGSLEVEYRRDVARWVPKLAPQIVVMVSETQWRGEVADELEGRTGRRWVLECHTPKAAAKGISLGGRERPYVVESRDGLERTVLAEVED